MMNIVGMMRALDDLHHAASRTVRLFLQKGRKSIDHPGTVDLGSVIITQGKSFENNSSNRQHNFQRGMCD